MTTCSSLTSSRRRFAAGLKSTLAQLCPARPSTHATIGTCPAETSVQQASIPASRNGAE